MEDGSGKMAGLVRATGKGKHGKRKYIQSEISNNDRRGKYKN